jgi:hypothetical protein
LGRGSAFVQHDVTCFAQGVTPRFHKQQTKANSASDYIRPTYEQPTQERTNNLTNLPDTICDCKNWFSGSFKTQRTKNGVIHKIKTFLFGTTTLLLLGGRFAYQVINILLPVTLTRRYWTAISARHNIKYTFVHNSSNTKVNRCFVNKSVPHS